jgi:hydrogenase maturation protease
MRLLIAGIGNIFRGDDAFGCEVARLLSERALPAGVVVRDFGTRGFDLACALLDGYDGAVLLDAAARGRTPGTLYLIEPARAEARAAVDPHGLTPEHVLRLVAALGGEAPWVRVIGCEPGSLGDEDGATGLSEPVRAAVAEAAQMAEELIRAFVTPNGNPTRTASW